MAYLAIASRSYDSEVVLQLEPPGRSLAKMGEVSLGIDDTPATETLIEVLRSRALLGSIVDELQLDVEVAPVRFPLLGAAASRWYRGTTPAEPLLGLTRFAWGGERISIGELALPEGLLDQQLILVVGASGSYEVRSRDGRVILAGVVGSRTDATAGDGRIRILVSELKARPGTRFVVHRRSRSHVIEQLRGALRISEKGTKTGLVVVALRGPDPGRLAATLNAIVAAYERQQVDRKRVEAAAMLGLINAQLPVVKSKLEAAQNALEQYKVEHGIVDVSREADGILSRAAAVDKAIQDTELQRSDLQQRYTEGNKDLLAIDDKIAKLRRERTVLDTRMRALPAAEMKFARLMREVAVANDFHTTLMAKAQELQLVRAGITSDLRVLDRARVPDDPTSPRTAPVLLISIALGLCLGAVGAVARKSLYAGNDDPIMLEELTGTNVFSTVPRSAKQAALSRSWRRGAPRLLAAVDPGDPAVESLRAARTSLLFALRRAPNNIVVVTGPTVGVGKTFVTANLAYLMATAGRRVLVVDGDLRRGRIHEWLGGTRTPGITEALSGSASLADAIRHVPAESLDWLPTGSVPVHPAEAVGSDGFRRMLTELSSRYDVVFVDATPVLPVTDAAILAQVAGTTLLVLGAGNHRAGEILTAAKRLAQNGVRIHGTVLNDVTGAGARYSDYRYQYRYARRA
jgi:tyrosine-protein kinase Etk/Wzc